MSKYIHYFSSNAEFQEAYADNYEEPWTSLVEDSGSSITRVDFNKETIEFTVSGVSYTAKEGMTWSQWVDSAMNTGQFYVLNDMIGKQDVSNGYVATDPEGVTMVTDTDVISVRAYYITFMA